MEITAKVDMGRMNLSKDFPKPYYKQKTRDGELLYPEAEEECDHDVEGDCKYLYDFRVTVKNIDEVVQEQHYGMGLGGSMARSEAFPINGRIDRWALEMYQSSEIIVTRPSLHENQPPMAAINHYKFMNTEDDPRENYVEGAE